MRSVEKLGIAGELVGPGEAIQRPGLAPSPGAVTGETLPGDRSDERARFRVEGHPVEGRAVGSDEIARKCEHVLGAPVHEFIALWPADRLADLDEQWGVHRGVDDEAPLAAVFAGFQRSDPRVPALREGAGSGDPRLGIGGLLFRAGIEGGTEAGGKPDHEAEIVRAGVGRQFHEATGLRPRCLEPPGVLRALVEQP